MFLLGFTYWPVLQVLAGSLTVRAFGGAAHWGLGNYARLFADPHFARAVANNLIYAAGTIVPSLILALALALGLRETTRLSALLRTLLVLPLLIPLVAAASLFIFIFLPGAGLLDYYLAQLRRLGRDQLAGRSVAGARLDHCHHGVEEHRLLHAVLPRRAGRHPAGAAGRREDRRRRRLAALPPHHAAAAGADAGFVLVIAVLNALTQVDHVIVMTQGGPSDSTMLVLYYIYQQAHQNYDVGLASAATVVSVALLFALSMVSLRSLERGIHYEA